jgi:hypothetical protein
VSGYKRTKTSSGRVWLVLIGVAAGTLLLAGSAAGIWWVTIGRDDRDAREKARLEKLLEDVTAKFAKCIEQELGAYAKYRTGLIIKAYKDKDTGPLNPLEFEPSENLKSLKSQHEKLLFQYHELCNKHPSWIKRDFRPKPQTDF